MPPPLRALCRRLTRWRVLPEAREPNSAIINIYEPVGAAWAGASEPVLCSVFHFAPFVGSSLSSGGHSTWLWRILGLSELAWAGRLGAPWSAAAGCVGSTWRNWLPGSLCMLGLPTPR